jgi:hypothetical protein
VLMRCGRRLVQKRECTATDGGDRHSQCADFFERVRFHCERKSERPVPGGALTLCNSGFMLSVSFETEARGHRFVSTVLLDMGMTLFITRSRLVYWLRLTHPRP